MVSQATEEDTRGERIGNYWILRAPDPFGIPLPKPWEVLKLSPCIYPACRGSCYKIDKAFETEDEARGWVTSQIGESENVR